MKVIVTGGRDYMDVVHLCAVLDSIHQHVKGKGKITDIIEGGCPTGADDIARRWRSDNQVNGTTYHADWKAHGRSAGPRRNTKMCKENQDATVVACPGGRGTADCGRTARALGMNVIEIGEQQ